MGPSKPKLKMLQPTRQLWMWNLSLKTLQLTQQLWRWCLKISSQWSHPWKLKLKMLPPVLELWIWFLTQHLKTSHHQMSKPKLKMLQPTQQLWRWNLSPKMPQSVLCLMTKNKQMSANNSVAPSNANQFKTPNQFDSQRDATEQYSTSGVCHLLTTRPPMHVHCFILVVRSGSFQEYE